MVHYGHELAAQRVPGWEQYYISYKEMKKAIKKLRQRSAERTDDDRDEIIRSFAEMLDFQVEKIGLFLMQRQGELAAELIRLQKDKDVIVQAEDRAAVPELIESYRRVATDLLQLLQFVELNLTGARKILKKFEKNLGLNLIQAYITSRNNHPYSQLRHLMRSAGIVSLEGTIVHSLSELKRYRLLSHLSRSYSFSLYRQPTLPEQTEEEPMIKAIEGARERLQITTDFIRYLGYSTLIDLTTPAVDEEEPVHFWSLYLNLGCTFLYMVNYYIIVPSSDDYAVVLGVPPTVCGVMIGAMPVAALVASFVYSAWSNRSYSEPLIVSTVILITGNLMYALADAFDSVLLVLLGRAFCGLGGARAINRRYIADHVPIKERTKQSAAFVSASALGMAVGPALAGLFTLVDVHFMGITVNFVTAPGWLMSALWMLYLVLLIIFFKEPSHGGHSGSLQPSPHGASRLTHVRSRQGIASASSKDSLKVHLLEDDEEEGDEAEDKFDVESSVDDDEELKPAATLVEAIREMSVPVLLMLYVYFMLKLATEMLISESGVISKLYFHWTAPNVGLFLSFLGLTVLPVNFIVGSFISPRFPDRLVLTWLEGLTVVGLVLILRFGPLPYSDVQYIIAAIIIFVSTCALEGVNMSLLSKVMSPRLTKGTYNCGLLSTEAGTLARAIADGFITLVGGYGVGKLLNWTMVPTLAVALSCTFLTFRKYHSLRDAFD